VDLHLQGKVALVAASSQGLGKGIAAELVKEGANVMLVARDAAKLEIVHNELQLLKAGNTAYHQADITKLEDIQSMVKATCETFGKIDIVVNNAGGPPAGSIEQLSDEDWQSAFELNLLSYVRVIREVLPELRRNGGGKIINLASSSIKQPIPGLLLSNTFRTGIVGLTKTLAEELASLHIMINTVAPGKIATNRTIAVDQMKAAKLGVTRQVIEDETKKAIPLQRYGTPEEFGKVVAFLVSEVNSYMTGSSFLVDGGMIKSI
jgi:3-oxoacyl-[acyl-carrier protein] reductase